MRPQRIHLFPRKTKATQDLKSKSQDTEDYGAGEMVQKLSVLAAFPQDRGSIPSTHAVAHSESTVAVRPLYGGFDFMPFSSGTQLGSCL